MRKPVKIIVLLFLLAVIVTAGFLLVYVLEESRVNTCTGGDQIGYIKHALSADNVLTASFSNNTGTGINIDSISFGQDFAGPIGSTALGNVTPQGTFDIRVTNASIRGSKDYTGTILINYSTSRGPRTEMFTCTGRVGAK